MPICSPEENYRKVDEIPFDFQRRRMSVVVEEEEARHVLICKGAVEEIFSSLRPGRDSGRDRAPGTGRSAAHPGRDPRDLNEDGFRVIAVAYKETIEAKRAYSVADESGMVLLGYIAFLDPPKESAKLAIAKLHQHGVEVKVLTGDNDTVTRKICSEVGLEVSNIVLGKDLEV